MLKTGEGRWFCPEIHTNIFFKQNLIMHSMCHRARKNIHFIWNLCAGCLKLIEAVRFWNRIYFFLYHKSGFVSCVAIISNSMNKPTDNLFAPTYQNRYRWNESFSMTSNFLFPAWTNNWKKKNKNAQLVECQRSMESRHYGGFIPSSSHFSINAKCLRWGLTKQNILTAI